MLINTKKLKIHNHIRGCEPTIDPNSTLSGLLPFLQGANASAMAQKLQLMGKERSWSASSPYFFPGIKTETVLVSNAAGT